MSEYYPDRWKVIKLDHNGETFYKVMAGWSGGYCHGDSWKLSSCVEFISEDENAITFRNNSGSRYICNKMSEGFTSYSYSVFLSIQEETNKPDSDIAMEEISYSNLPKELFA